MWVSWHLKFSILGVLMYAVWNHGSYARWLLSESRQRCVIIILTFIELLLNSKCFSWDISKDKPYLLSAPFYRWRNWKLKRLGNFLRVIGLGLECRQCSFRAHSLDYSSLLPQYTFREILNDIETRDIKEERRSLWWRWW